MRNMPHAEALLAAPAPPVCAPKGTKLENFENFRVFFVGKQKVTKCAICVRLWNGRSGILKPYT